MKFVGEDHPIVTLEVVAAYLEGLAINGEPVTYSDLLEYFGLPRISKRYLWNLSPMKDIFLALDSADAKAGRPLRATMVVRKDTRIPGNGYFRSLCGYREILIPESTLEKRELHKGELGRLAGYYRTKGVELG